MALGLLRDFEIFASMQVFAPVQVLKLLLFFRVWSLHLGFFLPEGREQF